MILEAADLSAPLDVLLSSGGIRFARTHPAIDSALRRAAHLREMREVAGVISATQGISAAAKFCEISRGRAQITRNVPQLPQIIAFEPAKPPASRVYPPPPQA